ncbi:MAG TPA: SoxR reducing system RseC family protein [Candidatus Cloacimonadota bacterium]|nr:SoxR reducing system RseC family protein [Candidatus Cloacimonadota bacterium]
MEPEVLQEDVGTVVRMEGRMATVELKRSGGCKSCSMRGICFSKNTDSVFELPTDLALEPGDKVRIEISARTRIMSSVLIFLVPIFFLFAAFILASHWLQELPAILISFGAMALSFLLVRVVDRRIGQSLDIRIGDKL